MMANAASVISVVIIATREIKNDRMGTTVSPEANLNVSVGNALLVFTETLLGILCSSLFSHARQNPPHW